MLRQRNISIFITLAFLLLVSISNAAPTSSIKYIVAYSNFTATHNVTVNGFVTYVELGQYGTTITGQFNTGFKDPDTSKYTFYLLPSGIDLTGTFNYTIQNDGTSAFTVL